MLDQSCRMATPLWRPGKSVGVHSPHAVMTRFVYRPLMETTSITGHRVTNGNQGLRGPRRETHVLESLPYGTASCWVRCYPQPERSWMATPTWRRPGTMSYCVASRSPTRGFVSRSHPRPRGSSFVARRGGSVARGVLVTAEFSGPRPQDPDIGASAGWIVLSSFLTPRYRKWVSTHFPSVGRWVSTVTTWLRIREWRFLCTDG